MKKDQYGKIVELEGVKVGDKFNAPAWLAGDCEWEVVGFRLDVSGNDHEAVCQNNTAAGPFEKFSIGRSVKVRMGL